MRGAPARTAAPALAALGLARPAFARPTSPLAMPVPYEAQRLPS